MSAIGLSVILMFSLCTPKPAAETHTLAETPKPNYGGYESQVKWGEHLVTICGCNDCHTPKKMGPNGPELDMSLMLSGHPSQTPPFCLPCVEWPWFSPPAVLPFG